MRKNEMGIGDIIVESLTIFGMILYLGLQMFYICRYPIHGMTMVFHFLAVLLLYGGMMVLQCHPEIYAVRMVRLCKFLIVYGILVPSMADVMGMSIDEAYSLIVMAGVLAVIAYYIYRIYQYNKEEEKNKKKKK